MNHSSADCLEDIVGRRAVDEQVPLSGRDDDLIRAIVLAGHDRLPAAEHVARGFCGDVLHAGARHGFPASRSVTLPRIKTPRGSLTSITFLTAPLVHANSTWGTRYGWPSGGWASGGSNCRAMGWL